MANSMPLLNLANAFFSRLVSKDQRSNLLSCSRDSSVGPLKQLRTLKSLWLFVITRFQGSWSSYHLTRHYVGPLFRNIILIVPGIKCAGIFLRWNLIPASHPSLWQILYLFFSVHLFFFILSLNLIKNCLPPNNFLLNGFFLQDLLIFFLNFLTILSLCLSLVLFLLHTHKNIAHCQSLFMFSLSRICFSLSIHEERRL